MSTPMSDMETARACLGRAWNRRSGGDLVASLTEEFAAALAKVREDCAGRAEKRLRELYADIQEHERPDDDGLLDGITMSIAALMELKEPTP